MRISNEEKQALLFDNQNIQNAYTELEFEHSQMERDMADFMCFRNGQATPNDYNQMDAIVANTNRLV